MPCTGRTCSRLPPGAYDARPSPTVSLQQAGTSARRTGGNDPCGSTGRATRQSRRTPSGDRAGSSPVAQEHAAAREGVAFFDLSSFSTFDVTGPESLAVLQDVCTADVDVAVGRVAYTLVLNRRGGIELDGTVLRLDADAFLVVVPSYSQRKAWWWLRRAADVRACDRRRHHERDGGAARRRTAQPGALVAPHVRRRLRRGSAPLHGRSDAGRGRHGPGRPRVVHRQPWLRDLRGQRLRSRRLRGHHGGRGGPRAASGRHARPRLAAVGGGLPPPRPRHRAERHPCLGGARPVRRPSTRTSSARTR